jgi:D-alanyl-D-alanine carboxypeptidase (penicillin-binding protein 5/6)
VETNISSVISKDISNEITVINGRNRNLLLEKYDDDSKKWEIKKTFSLNNEDRQIVNIEYPNEWKDSNSSSWRITIDENDSALKYQSDTISITASNRYNISLVASSALIFDNDTSQIYYQKNINKKRSIASTTKILTCLVALENTQLDDTVTLTSEAVTTHLTKLRGVGDKVKMKDLLYAAMVASDNGSATAIAQYTGGSIKNFAKMMNERAIQIGCTSSHFTNPQGFTSDNHYSTALDLALITQEAYKNKELRKIVKAKSYSFTTLKKKNTYEYNTTNKLLGEISGVTGMKTGTTSAAGKCNVCTYTHNNKTYIIVVLGSSQEGRWNDTKKLINYVNQYC